MIEFINVINEDPTFIVGEEFFKPKYKTLDTPDYIFNGNSFNEDFILIKQIALRKIKDNMTYLTDYIMLEVSDNGPGIDPVVGKKIFNSFVSTKKNDNNMGLGLAIVRTIVTSFFGTIKVLSNEMGGATFVVSLPPVLESCKEGA